MPLARIIHERPRKRGLAPCHTLQKKLAREHGGTVPVPVSGALGVGPTNGDRHFAESHQLLTPFGVAAKSQSPFVSFHE